MTSELETLEASVRIAPAARPPSPRPPAGAGSGRHQKTPGCRECGTRRRGTTRHQAPHISSETVRQGESAATRDDRQPAARLSQRRRKHRASKVFQARHSDHPGEIVIVKVMKRDVGFDPAVAIIILIGE